MMPSDVAKERVETNIWSLRHSWPEYPMSKNADRISKYSGFYQTELGKSIAKEEAKIVIEELAGCDTILSVGCGTGRIESLIREELSSALLICLDRSREMLAHVADPGYTVQGDATELPMADGTMDAILFLTSLEFIDDLPRAVDEAARVLSENGRALFISLNFDSAYFREKMLRRDSYVGDNIVTAEHSALDAHIARRFEVRRTYFALEIADGRVKMTADPAQASIRVASAMKLTGQEDG